MKRAQTKPKASSSVYLKAKNERQQRILDGVAIWAAYYRSNPHRFVSEFLHINLKLFQIFLLKMMAISTVFVFIACRG